MAHATTFNKPANDSPPKADDRIESLAREVFVASTVNYNHGVEVEHMAKQAIDSAKAFYSVWNKREQVNGRQDAIR